MKKARRIISMLVAVVMMTPAVASVAEAAIVSWLSPQPGQRISARNVEVAVGYNTQSDLKVTRLELWIDGELYSRRNLMQPDTRGVCSFWWDTTRYSDGQHDLLVKVYAGDKLISKVTSTGTVGSTAWDSDPPVVIFANVKAGDVLKGTYDIKLNATDDSGEPPLVSLLVDNSLKLVKNRPPYSYALDTTTYADGDHELQTYAYDVAGNKSDPSVVKVAFRNNAPRPVVTTVTVAPSKGPAASEDDGVGVVEAAVPEVKVPPVERKTAAKRPSAGRVVKSGTEQAASAEPAAPIASVVKPTANVRSSELTHAPKVEPKRPVEPAAEAKPPALRDRTMVVAKLAETNVEAGRSTVSLAPAEPKLVKAPDVCEVSCVSAVVPPGLRGESHEGAASPTSMRSQEMLPHPVTSDVKRIRTSVPSANVRVAKVDGLLTMVRQTPAAPPVPDVAKSKPVASANPVPKAKLDKVAVAPFVKDIDATSKTKVRIECRPSAKSDTNAKLEKRTLPASGKVKVRDLFDELGGLLFWDQATHTVMAYAGSMEIVMKIGSTTATVNGKVMRLQTAPYIVNGRTIIDAGAYQRALALANGEMNVSSSTE